MKIKEIKIINQDESTEIANIGADAINVDYNDTTVKAELDKLNSDNNLNKGSITNLQSGLNTTNSNLALQTSRIDNLATLEEGSTTGDAELIDGRIGYNGESYANIGSNIRETDKNINNFNLYFRKMLNNKINDLTYGESTEYNLIYSTVGLVTNIDWAAAYTTFNSVADGVSTGVLVIPIDNIVGQIVIEKSLGQRCKITFTNEYPKVGSAYYGFYTGPTTVTSTGEYKYLVVLFYHSTIDSSLTLEEILSTIKIYKYDDATNIENRITKVDEVTELLYTGSKNLYSKTLPWVPLMKNANDNTFARAGTIKSVIIPIVPNAVISIEKMITDRFMVYSSSLYPESGVTINNVFSHSGTETKITITSGNEDYYLCIYLASQSWSGNLDDLKNSIKVYYGENWEERELITTKLSNEIESLSPSYWYENSNLINLCSYRPLGQLSRGYICLTCDDGNEALVNYTIPKIKELDTLHNTTIPLTLALMTNSTVLNNNTQKAVIQDFLENYGASVAIHGSPSYTSFTTNELIEFLNTQRDGLTTLCNTAPTSIIYPNHDYNTTTATIAGSYYGVCGTGGNNKPIRYNGNMVGPRSNLYTLYRASLLNSSVTTSVIKQWIDTAYEEHLIIIPFWHDIEFSRDSQGRTKEENLELLEYCIEYALSKGLTFINLGDIPNII